MKKPTLKEVERAHFLKVLKFHDWNRTHAALELGLSTRTIRHRIAALRKQGFPVQDYKRWPDQMYRNEKET